MAAADSPLESNLYAVEIPRGSKVTRITQAEGRHSIKVNEQFTQVYDTYTNHATPRTCQLISLKNGRPVTTNVLYTAANPYLQNEKHATLARPEVELGTLKAADGVTDLYYRLVKPRDYDKHPDRRYPVIVYLYNGPHAQLVTDGFQWGLPGWDCYMANRGYVVFTIDGRGSDNRGLAFEQAIWHNLGQVEALDQMQGVAYLKTLPYVDADRIGIYGWSYGGFMTTYMMLNYPETFKVGVCGGPVLDWSRYERLCRALKTEPASTLEDLAKKAHFSQHELEMPEREALAAAVRTQREALKTLPLPGRMWYSYWLI
jgi:dipeptidyl-peptidase-4